jgi:hypothetical protein
MDHSEIILDQQNVQQVLPAVNLKRSLRLLWCYAIEAFFIILVALGKNFMVKPDVAVMIVGIGAIVSFALAPFGLYSASRRFEKKKST